MSRSDRNCQCILMLCPTDSDHKWLIYPTSTWCNGSCFANIKLHYWQVTRFMAWYTVARVLGYNQSVHSSGNCCDQCAVCDCLIYSKIAALGMHARTSFIFQATNRSGWFCINRFYLGGLWCFAKLIYWKLKISLFIFPIFTNDLINWLRAWHDCCHEEWITFNILHYS